MILSHCLFWLCFLLLKDKQIFLIVRKMPLVCSLSTYEDGELNSFDCLFAYYHLLLECLGTFVEINLSSNAENYLNVC